MLPDETPLQPLRDVASTFGQDFADALMKLSPGQWSGPVGSSFGLHLVLVRDRTAGAAADLATVRPLVERELLAEPAQGRVAGAVRALAGQIPGQHRHAGRAGCDGRSPRCAVTRRFVQALAAPRAVLLQRGHRARGAPRFLELTQTAEETYNFLWKKPSGGESNLQIAPVVPAQCRLVVPGAAATLAGCRGRARPVVVSGRIAGKTLAIAGLESTITDVLVRVNHADGRLESHLLRPTSASVTFGGDTGLAERALGYVQLGFQHILLGADHLLFVLGLMLIVADRWMLVKTLTAFTVAHSITLALATLVATPRRRCCRSTPPSR